ncbi:Dihydroneopterin aldolase [Roseomonas mucosa]|uniref:dihydroneopterin aldolase n=1 Tax=Roseomonas mucosa TaxID=207340 RepID=A0A4Y1N1T4_9PROT|nr:dihydroneopterin aldolase [Roseomonas mucosa]AWV24202.1 Dihydroneopterin aldolase [Roseomonas mucosa]MDT8355682.1 dihydroneopterin aldolase [Roseomonas mucosa]
MTQNRPGPAFPDAAPASAYRPDAARRLRRVFVRGLEVRASLGVLPYELHTRQRVIIGIELLVEDESAPASVGEEKLARVVDYGAVAARAREIATTGHIRLAETLAERIAVAALEDRRIVSAMVTVEKPDVLPDAAAVGVTVERQRPAAPRPKEEETAGQRSPEA